jgi:hypothetical protein
LWARRALPVGGEVTGDYVFDSPSGPATVAGLFANGKDALYLYNFMFIGAQRGTLVRGVSDCARSVSSGFGPRDPAIPKPTALAQPRHGRPIFPKSLGSRRRWSL